MTRWQVLEANMNPTLQPMDKSVWARFIGEHTETSIRRNSYCRVAYKDWWLSKTEVMERLDPNNYKVDAYYLTDEDGKATDVYIFQNDRLIDKLEDVGTFNTADAEQTDEDKEIFVNQQKKIAAFNAYVKKNAIASVSISKAEQSAHEEAAPPPPFELPPMESEQEMEVSYHISDPLADL